ncbi:Uncharacterised protein [Salmonella enterica]|nr:Uncharacterised protein [Salmonella enterica]
MNIAIDNICPTIFLRIQFTSRPAGQLPDIAFITKNLKMELILSINHSGRAQRGFTINFSVSFNLCFQMFQVHIQRVKNNLSVFPGTNFSLMFQ